MNRFLAEMIGTFMLVLVGAGAIAIALPHFWISVAFGAIVTAMILCFGKVSGAHINPAVSLAFYISERRGSYLTYILFQLMGGLIAAIALFLLLPSNPTYGETLPRNSIGETFIIEVFITFVLMMSIYLIARTGKLLAVAMVVGFVVFLAAYFAGPYTGASMNPARSLGPNMVSGDTNVLWLYFIAPFMGATGAAFLNKFLIKTTI